jgi:hypothetical protein
MVSSIRSSTINFIWMKYICLLLSLFILCPVISGQKKSFFYNKEISFSLNHNFFDKKNYPSGTGFGIGIYNRLFSEHKLNLILGCEYNRIHFYTKDAYYEKYSHFYNVTYSLNNMAMPVTLRYYTGNNIKFFAEAGFYTDFGFFATGKGTYTYRNSYVDPPVSTGPKIKTEGYLLFFFDYGFRPGIGIEFHVAHAHLLIKTDYTQGFEDNGIRSSLENFHVRYFLICIAFTK